MADFKYKIDWVPDSKKLRETVTPDVEPQGIASRPAPAQDKKEDMDFYTKMYEIMSAYFDTDEEAEQVLSSKKPDAAKAKQFTMEEFERMTEASADRGRAYREDKGITQSLVEGGGEAYRKKPPEGTITRPVARPDELVSDTAKDVEESAPVTAETESAGLMSDPRNLGGAEGYGSVGTSADEGLMTRPKARPELNSIEDVSNRYGSTVGGVMKEFETVEGLEPHIGKDWENVTLAYGIVPDKGLKIDGLDVPDSRNKRGVWLKKNGYVDAAGKATAKFAKANVDNSNVSKEGIDRNLFNSDLEWSAAVVNEFNKKVAAEYDMDTLSEEAKKGLLDIAWNGGGGSLAWSGTKAWVAEANKAPEDRITSNVLDLTKHNTESGKPVRGLVARRSRMANTLLPNDEKVAFIEQRGKETKLFTQDGTLLKTIKTKNTPSSPDGWIDVNGNDLGVEELMFSPRPQARK